MKFKRRIFVSLFWIFFGALLFVIGTLEAEDSFWSGMGTGFFVIGVMQVIKQIKYRTNAEYREKVDISEKDERTKFISGRAYAWSSYIYIITAAIATIGFKLAGYNELSLFSSVSICFIVLVYAVATLILNKKY